MIRRGEASRAGSDPALLGGAQRRAHPVANLELLGDLLEMGLHGVLAEMHLCGDLGVREAFADQPQDRQLGGVERRSRRRGGSRNRWRRPRCTRRRDRHRRRCSPRAPARTDGSHSPSARLRATNPGEARVGALPAGYDRLCTQHGRSCALRGCRVRVRLHVRGSAPDRRNRQFGRTVRSRRYRTSGWCRCATLVSTRTHWTQAQAWPTSASVSITGPSSSHWTGTGAVSAPRKSPPRSKKRDVTSTSPSGVARILPV